MNHLFLKNPLNYIIPNYIIPNYIMKSKTMLDYRHKNNKVNNNKQNNKNNQNKQNKYIPKLNTIINNTKYKKKSLKIITILFF